MLQDDKDFIIVDGVTKVTPGNIINTDTEMELIVTDVEIVSVYYVRKVHPGDVKNKKQFVGVVEPILTNINNDHRGRGIRIAMRDMKLHKDRKKRIKDKKR